MGRRIMKAGSDLRAQLVPQATSDKAMSVYDTSSEIQRTMVTAVNKVKSTLDAFSAFGVTQINNPDFLKAKAVSDTLEAFVNPTKGHRTSTSIGTPGGVASLKADAQKVCDAQILDVKNMLTSTGGSLMNTGSNFTDVINSLKANIKLSKDRVDADTKKFKEYSEQLSEEDKKLSNSIKRQTQGGMYSLVNTLQNTSPDKRLGNIVSQINKNVSNSITKMEGAMANMEGNKLFLSQAIPLLKFLESNAPAAKKLQAVKDFTNGNLKANMIVDMETVQKLAEFYDNTVAAGWAKKDLEAPLLGKNGTTVGDMISDLIKKLGSGNGTSDEVLELYKLLNEIWIRNSKLSTLDRAKLMGENAKATDIAAIKALSRRELAMIIAAHPEHYNATIGKSNIEFVNEYLKNKWYEEGYPGRYGFIWNRIEKKTYTKYINELRKSAGKAPLPP